MRTTSSGTQQSCSGSGSVHAGGFCVRSPNQRGDSSGNEQGTKGYGDCPCPIIMPSLTWQHTWIMGPDTHYQDSGTLSWAFLCGQRLPEEGWVCDLMRFFPTDIHFLSPCGLHHTHLDWSPGSATNLGSLPDLVEFGNKETSLNR